LRLPFRWLRENQPGPNWQHQFGLFWPSYEDWFLREGEARRPALEVCRLRLEQYMPELVSTWESLSALAGGHTRVARMLGLYRPTPYLAGCSQAVWSRGEPLLIRNYDYHPSKFEGVFLHSSWSGTKTIAASDCLWGALDGINEHGLVVALSFGGRRVVGEGFGAPLLLRYALETCHTTAETVALLLRIPSHMAYNVSVLDASGAYAVVHLSPDRPAWVTGAPVATNHQAGVEWSAYGHRTLSAERENLLYERLHDSALDAESFIDSFMRPPLFATDYARSFGTLYTAVYAPQRRSVSYRWPGARVEQSIDDFREQELSVPLHAGTTPSSL